MMTIGRKSDNAEQALRELVTSLDNRRPVGTPVKTVVRDVKKSVGILGGNWYRRWPAGFTDEYIDLVISPCRNSGTLLSLMGQLDETLHQHDSWGNIMHTAYTGGGSTIRVEMQPPQFSNLIIKLARIPAVDRVQEQPYVPDNHAGRFGTLPGAATRPTKCVMVMLNNTEVPEQVAPAMVN